MQNSSPLLPNATEVVPRPSTRFDRWLMLYRRAKHYLLLGLISAVTTSIAAPGFAAEQLTMRLGPLEQTVSIADLERFAETGKIPEALWLYTPILTPEVQQALHSQLWLEPQVSQKLVEDLVNSSAGQRFLTTLQSAIPESDPKQLQVALMHAAQHPDDVSLLSFLRSMPGNTVTVDVPSVVALASQVNLPSWQSQLLSSVLDRELSIQSRPFKPAFDPAARGDYRVNKETMKLRDYRRDRLIPFDLYWADRSWADRSWADRSWADRSWADKAEAPLVVISHGFGADRRFLGYLADHLASYGITVVAIEHPGSNVSWLINDSSLNQIGASTIDSILPATEFVDRPKDVSFVLDRLAYLNQFSSTLQGKLQTEQVTMIGHSLGGYTALALAGAPLNLKHLRDFCKDPDPVALSPADLIQCNAADLKDPPTELRDRRIAQAMILNPVIGRLFDSRSLAQVEIPVLMLASTEDSITPAVSQQFLPFTQLKAPEKFLLTAIGATHLSVGDPENLNRALTQSIFLRERSDAETDALRHLLRGLSLAFVQQVTPERDRYHPFISAAYVQSFSTEHLQLRLNAELPPNFTNWLKVTALPLEQFVSSTLAKPKSEAKFGICRSSLSCLLSSLPLAMFILPGGLPLTGRLKRSQKQKHPR